MAKIMFISVESLKDKSVLQANTDEKVLALSIQEFQDIELTDILGETEFNRLSEELTKVVQITGYQLSTEDAALMAKITPVMIYGALMYSITPLKIRFANKGLQELTEDGAKGAAAAEARANYAFKLDKYKAKLTDYIAKSQAQPVPCAPNNTDSTFGFTGISLPDVEPDYEKRYNDYYYNGLGLH